MKKTLLFSIFTIIAASSAYAFTLNQYGTDLPTGLNGKLSTNVKLVYNHSGDTPTSGYVAGTSHGQGTKTYASSSGDAQLFTKDGTEQALPTTMPTGTQSADFTGWSSL